MQGIFNICKSIHLINQINTLKKKNHMIISADGEKDFSKIQHSCIYDLKKKKRTLHKVGLQQT